MCVVIGVSVFCCLFLGAIISSISTAVERDRRLEVMLSEMRSILSAARRNGLNKFHSDRFFDIADQAVAIIPETKEYKKMKYEIERMSKEMGLLVAVRSPSVSVGEDIDKLANLRKNGMISEHEFQAFSERFKLTTGEKASGVIKAITELFEQYKQGAMSEGNYHSALWSLLDKLDRKI